jgi:hypothetical protein
MAFGRLGVHLDRVPARLTHGFLQTVASHGCWLRGRPSGR